MVVFSYSGRDGASVRYKYITFFVDCPENDQKITYLPTYTKLPRCVPKLSKIGTQSPSSRILINKATRFKLADRSVMNSGAKFLSIMNETGVSKQLVD